MTVPVVCFRALLLRMSHIVLAINGYYSIHSNIRKLFAKLYSVVIAMLVLIEILFNGFNYLFRQ